MQVHVRDPGDPRRIVVSVDTAAGWHEQWQQGNIESSNEELNATLSKFNLSIADTSAGEQSGAVTTVVLETELKINGYAGG
ncbi:MAG: hypothetical protein U5J63_14110 [Fodinibius sp.]|nr:hypothetical protein [Fodinibius sp.]